MIPYGRQDIREDDIAAVRAALVSDFLTQGPRVPAFEAAVAAKVGAGFAIAANSATSALHVACQALGLAPGDWLWTSPITFVASANCGRYCGASIDLVDIDPETFNMSADALEIKLIAAEKNGTLPKIVVPVAMCGQSCDMRRIRDLADKYGFAIVEDASHAIGGRYDDAYVGNGAFADITVFSFHPVKIITTAEGGMAVTNNPALAARMRLFCSHGITRNEDQMQGDSDGPWYYQQIKLGQNYRMTELQAALGLSQLERLDEYVAIRAAQARRYQAELSNLPLSLPYEASGVASAWHLFVIRLQEAGRRRVVFEQLRAAGIGVNVHYIPIHLQPYYRALGFAVGDYPLSEDYYSRVISIPLFSAMTVTDQTEVITKLGAVLQG
ncbi:MAG: UDP-4-amino-4,6-dideoxy-N-acetyl-beta-L-altrosamine transaminase [Paracoccaceae bacterium]